MPHDLALPAHAALGQAISTRRAWTAREDKILRQILPTQGVDAALAALPGRSRSAIQLYGYRIGVRPPDLRTKRRPWGTSDHIDAAIRRVYQTDPSAGAIRHLEQTLGRPRQWIRKRAEQLGCVVPRLKEPEWTAAEDAIVVAHAAMHIDVIARKLRRAGFSRTACAVRCRIDLLRARVGIDRDRPDVMTASEVARCLGVHSKTPTIWIAKGLLKAKRHKTEQPQYHGDAHWEISRANLRRFIIENVALVDLRKADKYWLVELLAVPK